jgi:hypothetical protein
MIFFRKLIKYKKLSAFLAIGMLLRSSIAVGYMLDTNPENGDLFSVMICEGPAGINAVTGLDSATDSHVQHHGHHGGDNADNNNDHAVAQDHPASSCSFWSASSLSLLADISFLDTTGYFLSDEIVIYENNLKLRLSNNTCLARAPPTLN